MVEGTSNERAAWNGTYVTSTYLDEDDEYGTMNIIYLLVYFLKNYLTITATSEQSTNAVTMDDAEQSDTSRGNVMPQRHAVTIVTRSHQFSH